MAAGATSIAGAGCQDSATIIDGSRIRSTLHRRCAHATSPAPLLLQMSVQPSLPPQDAAASSSAAPAAPAAREVTVATPLCDASGCVSAAAIGWSRHPLIDCAITGYRLRKKRWNYCANHNSTQRSISSHAWNELLLIPCVCVCCCCLCVGAALSPELLFSATLSHIDYAAVYFVYVLDLKSLRFEEHTVLVPFGIGNNVCMPSTVAQSLSVCNSGLSISFEECAEDCSTRIRVECPQFGSNGGSLSADLLVRRPRGPEEESLNVVVPWSRTRFQCTSKQAALPTDGQVVWDGKVYRFGAGSKGNGTDAADSAAPPAAAAPASASAVSPAVVPSFACLDFGRGVWPYRCSWNWASGSCLVSGGRRLGINFGGRWTDGTGQNENGILLDGRLTKIHCEVQWEYDRADWMKPWSLRTNDKVQSVALTFTPLFDRKAASNLIVVSSEVHQMIGTFDGHVVTAEGERIEIKGMQGWCEEHQARW